MKPFLKCDAKGCDHHEEVEGFKKEYIGKPCPKCGASLLTEEDWKAMQPLAAMIEILKAAGVVVPDNSKGPAIPMVIGHHAGETTIKFKDGK